MICFELPELGCSGMAMTDGENHLDIDTRTNSNNWTLPNSETINAQLAVNLKVESNG